MKHRATLRSVLYAGILGCSPMTATIAQEAYTLGPLDKIRIIVSEWEVNTASLKDWSLVGGEYTISASASLAFPFLGNVQVAGKTPTDLGEEMTAALIAELAVNDRLSVSVEVVEYRPVFVSGSVEVPGSFPFLPGLTVVKAVALAGGLAGFDTAETGNPITEMGQRSLLIAERASLLATLARVDAELSGATSLTVSDEIDDYPGAQALIDSETNILEANLLSLRTRRSALGGQMAAVEMSVATLAQKQDLQQQRLTNIQADLERAQTLRASELTTNSRINDLQSGVAAAEISLLDVQQLMLSAQQQLGNIDRNLADLNSGRIAELQIERKEIVAELVSVRLRLATVDQQLTQSLPTSQNSQDGITSQYLYTIVRSDTDKSLDAPVDETTEMVPGDVLKVQLVLDPVESAADKPDPAAALDAANPQ